MLAERQVAEIIARAWHAYSGFGDRNRFEDMPTDYQAALLARSEYVRRSLVEPAVIESMLERAGHAWRTAAVDGFDYAMTAALRAALGEDQDNDA